MQKLILAIDFDETIVQCDFPRIIKLRPDAKKIINQLYDDGYYIIIWTCRHGDHALEAETYLLKNGIRFNKFNQHHPALIKRFRNDTRKISADVYIDDKCVGGLPTWKEIYRIIKKKDGVQIPLLIDSDFEQ